MVWSTADAYSGGAPTSPRVCSGMVPGHGPDPQKSPAPYNIDVKPAQSGATLSIAIMGESGTTFTGFMVQARNANNKNQILDGIFTEDKQSQIKSCNSNRAVWLFFFYFGKMYMYTF